MLTPIFKKIFPAAEIDPSKRALERWGTLRGGVQHAVSTGGKMTKHNWSSKIKLIRGNSQVDNPELNINNS